MKRELEQKFYNRWPTWFIRDDPKTSLMCFGFTCEDGWFKVLWELCEQIEPLAPVNFQVIQVKEKFGGLRFYINHHLDSIDNLIHLAEAKCRFRQAEEYQRIEE